eukprot:6436025-Pyramimonas_sp.AAC.1
MLRRRAFRQSHIQEIVEPPKELAGRGGAVRLKSPTFDILVIVAFILRRRGIKWITGRIRVQS